MAKRNAVTWIILKLTSSAVDTSPRPAALAGVHGTLAHRTFPKGREVAHRSGEDLGTLAICGAKACIEAVVKWANATSTTPDCTNLRKQRWFGCCTTHTRERRGNVPV